MTITPSSRVLHLLRCTTHLLVSFPLLLTAFITVTVLSSLGLSTLILWIGIPILLFMVYAARGFASLERSLVSWVTGEPTVGHYRPVQMEPSAWRRFIAPLQDRQSWLDMGWAIVGFLLSLVTWSLTVTWVAGTLSLFVTPIFWFIPDINVNGPATLLGLPYATFLDAAISITGGLFFALTAPVVLRGLSSVQCGLSRALLCGQSREAYLLESRAAAQETESSARRQLERDIHDGPQQRLIRIGMDLGRARRKLDGDSEAVAIIDDLIDQTSDTLTELRHLSHGIVPPVLTDRGLASAIEEAASLSTVPVTVRADLPRMSPQVEQTAYYVTSEALANVNKHSAADSAMVLAFVQDGALHLSISDDGVGGADPAKGQGLTGLRQRLADVDGQLVVDSPAGGPTRIEAVIPCA